MKSAELRVIFVIPDRPFHRAIHLDHWSEIPRPPLVLGDPEIAIFIMAATFHHLHSLVLQLEQIKAYPGTQRVAEFLIGLCPVYQGACMVALPYDKSLIAGRLGMNPESLSRAFAKLRNHGMMVRHRHAAISDVAEVHAFAMGDEDLPLRKSVQGLVPNTLVPDTTQAKPKQIWSGPH